MEFQPTIVSFLCNWCSYTGADLAGTSRMKYAHNIRIIRTMCSGRVDPTFVLESFKKGADGVLICGCHPGDCHYINGNFKARRRFKLMKTILNQFGFEEERLRLTWIGASDGLQFAETIKEMVEQLKDLEPKTISVKKAV